MEELDRGVVAVNTIDHVFISWRLSGYDPQNAVFSLYRSDDNGASFGLVAGNLFLTNYQDFSGNINSLYKVAMYSGGSLQDVSDPVSVWATQYMKIDVSAHRPPDPALNYRYVPYTATIADLTGNGQYDLIFAMHLQYMPGAGQGMPPLDGRVDVPLNFVTAYSLDGTHLWTINLGPNKCSPATWVIIADDFAGIGRAQVAVRIGDGAVDGQGRVLGDPYVLWREINNERRNRQGPFYIAVFDGLTGAVLDYVPFYPQTFGDERGPWEWYTRDGRHLTGATHSSAYIWGDARGHRGLSGFHGTVAFLDGETPSMIFHRGMYGSSNEANAGPGRITTTAWDFCINNGITNRWIFDTFCRDSPQFLHPVNYAAIAQGHHSLVAGQIDGTGRDSIILGSVAIGYDGNLLWNSGRGHGDAHHLGKFDPYRVGLQYHSVYESWPYGMSFVDAADPSIRLMPHVPGNDDTGRGIAGIWGEYFCHERQAYALAFVGGSEGVGTWAYFGADIPPKRMPYGALPYRGYMRVFWDGDLWAEYIHGEHANQAATARVMKPNPNGQMTPIFELEGVRTNRWSHAILMLVADLFGDWREEIVGRSWCSNYVIIFTTVDPTQHRFYTFMHDPLYRLGVSFWNGGTRNMIQHLSFYLADRDGYRDLQPTPNQFTTTRRGIFVTEHPQSHVQVSAGQITEQLHVTAVHEPNNSALTFQWYINTSNSRIGGTAIPGANSATLDIPYNLILGNHYFYVEIRGTNTPMASSFVSTVRVVPPTGDFDITGLTVTPDELTLILGDPDPARNSYTLTAAVEPEIYADKIEWFTLPEGVVSVDDYGFIEAVGIGVTRVVARATDGSYLSDYTLVEVIPFVPVTAVTVQSEGGVTQVYERMPLQLTATITPANATNMEIYSWISSDDGIATVDEYGLVTAISPGSVVITATADCGVFENNLVTGIFNITVNPVRDITNITIERSNFTLRTGSNYHATVVHSLTPANATYRRLLWSSSNPSVAIVNSYGRVTSVGVGNAVITVASANNPGIYATVNVEVREGVQLTQVDGTPDGIIGAGVSGAGNWLTNQISAAGFSSFSRTAHLYRGDIFNYAGSGSGHRAAWRRSIPAVMNAQQIFVEYDAFFGTVTGDHHVVEVGLYGGAINSGTNGTLYGTRQPIISLFRVSNSTPGAPAGWAGSLAWGVGAYTGGTVHTSGANIIPYFHVSNNEWIRVSKTVDFLNNNISMVIVGESGQRYEVRDICIAHLSADRVYGFLMGGIRGSGSGLGSSGHQFTNMTIYTFTGEFDPNFDPVARTREPISNVNVSIPAPSSLDIPVTAVDGEEYHGTITWSPAVQDNMFSIGTVYTGAFILQPRGNRTFEGIASSNVLVNGNAAENVTVSNDGLQLTFTVAFPATGGVGTPIEGIVLNYSTIMLRTGSNYHATLVPTITPANATNQDITWESSNPGIAAVSVSGRVTAVGIGTTVITASNPFTDITAAVTVTVREGVPLTQVDGTPYGLVGTGVSGGVNWFTNQVSSAGFGSFSRVTDPHRGDIFNFGGSGGGHRAAWRRLPDSARNAQQVFVEYDAFFGNVTGNHNVVEVGLYGAAINTGNLGEVFATSQPIIRLMRIANTAPGAPAGYADSLAWVVGSLPGTAHNIGVNIIPHFHIANNEWVRVSKTVDFVNNTASIVVVGESGQRYEARNICIAATGATGVYGLLIGGIRPGTGNQNLGGSGHQFTNMTVYTFSGNNDPNFDVQVLAVPPSNIAIDITTGIVGQPFTAELTANGDMPMTWALQDGTLPSGLSLSPAGIITGIPDIAAADHQFIIEATNAAGTASATLSITISPDTGVSMAALGEAIRYVESLDVNDFTRLSWALMHQVYMQAVALYNNEQATEQELEDMTARLLEAIDNLVLIAPPPPPVADKDALVAAIEYAEDLVISEFTRLNWVLLQDALNHARLVVGNENATQELVDAALHRLNMAKGNRITG